MSEFARFVNILLIKSNALPWGGIKCYNHPMEIKITETTETTETIENQEEKIRRKKELRRLIISTVVLYLALWVISIVIINNKYPGTEFISAAVIALVLAFTFVFPVLFLLNLIYKALKGK